MGNINTTRWINKRAENLDAGIELLFNNTEMSIQKGTISYTNINRNKVFEENQTINILDTEIQYNIVDFSFQIVTSGSEPVNLRTSPLTGFIIIYQTGDSVNYIINRNSDALKIIRMFCDYDSSNRGEIEQNKIEFNDDIFMWFISKVYSNDSGVYFDSDNMELSIRDILSFRGETVGENKVSLKGDTVLNLISALSFIIESNLLNQIIVKLKYLNHKNVEIQLNDTGLVSISDTSYEGVLRENNSNKTLFNAQLILTVYMDILPKLKRAFSLIEEEWLAKDKNEFYNLVKSDLINKIDTAK